VVKFITATCPSCGGELQIPDNLTKAFCSYCGATVLLEWEGRPGPGPTVASYMKLGIAAMQGLNYTDAYEYFAKALELNPDHREAWLWKGVAAGGCYEQRPGYAELTQAKFGEALQCLRQSGFTHDEMIALLVDGLKTNLPESNRSVVGRGGLDGAGLIGVSYWAAPDLALLYLDTAAEIEPSAITLYDYLHCIQEAGRAFRIDLVQNFAKSAITLAPEARSQIARDIYSAALYSGATTVETLNKAASMLELALQIDPASADEIAGSYIMRTGTMNTVQISGVDQRSGDMSEEGIWTWLIGLLKPD